MPKYSITSSEFNSMRIKLDSIDDWDSMLVYAPEYHKLAELSATCHDIYGEEVRLVDTPSETIPAWTCAPDGFIELPKKKSDTDTEVLLKNWLTEHEIVIIDDAKSCDQSVDTVDFRTPVSKIVLFLAQYFPQLNVILH